MKKSVNECQRKSPQKYIVAETSKTFVHLEHFFFTLMLNDPILSPNFVKYNALHIVFCDLSQSGFEMFLVHFFFINLNSWIQDLFWVAIRNSAQNWTVNHVYFTLNFRNLAWNFIIYAVIYRISSFSQCRKILLLIHPFESIFPIQLIFFSIINVWHALGHKARDHPL